MILTASDQSPSIKNLEAESKNIVKVTEKTKSKKRKLIKLILVLKPKYCALIIDLKNLKIMILIIKKNCDDTRRKRTRSFQQSQQKNVPEVKKKKLRVLIMKKKMF